MKKFQSKFKKIKTNKILLFFFWVSSSTSINPIGSPIRDFIAFVDVVVVFLVVAVAVVSVDSDDDDDAVAS